MRICRSSSWQQTSNPKRSPQASKGKTPISKPSDIPGQASRKGVTARHDKKELCSMQTQGRQAHLHSQSQQCLDHAARRTVNACNGRASHASCDSQQENSLPAAMHHVLWNRNKAKEAMDNLGHCGSQLQTGTVLVAFLPTSCPFRQAGKT